jgi:hypothetical protein
VCLHVHELTIIKACAPQPLLVQVESQWFDEVQVGSCIGAQTNDVAGVRRDFGLVENDRKHLG